MELPAEFLTNFQSRCHPGYNHLHAQLGRFASKLTQTATMLQFSIIERHPCSSELYHSNQGEPERKLQNKAEWRSRDTSMGWQRLWEPRQNCREATSCHTASFYLHGSREQVELGTKQNVDHFSVEVSVQGSQRTFWDAGS